MNKTSYEPFDGDYEDADYTKLLNDIQAEQGFDIGAFLEICVSLTDEDKIYICCSNDEGTEWKYTNEYPIPASWDIETVRFMFPGNVYLKTDDYVEPEQDEEEEE